METLLGTLPQLTSIDVLRRPDERAFLIMPVIAYLYGKIMSILLKGFRDDDN